MTDDCGCGHPDRHRELKRTENLSGFGYYCRYCLKLVRREKMTPTDKLRKDLKYILNWQQKDGFVALYDTAQEALAALDGMVLVPIDETDEDTIIFAIEQSVIARPSVDDEKYVMDIRNKFIAPYLGENHNRRMRPKR